MTSEATSSIPLAFRRQAASCLELGSPFTYRLLTLLADRLRPSTSVGQRLLDWPDNPIEDALGLRIAGALHALVLKGASPSLREHYPPNPQTSDNDLWDAVAKAFERHDQDILQFIESPPQTNEVARSAALASGFMTIAAQTSLPLAIFEIGASAGLNLHWDSFGYKLGGRHIRATENRPLLQPAWQGPPPPIADAVVIERGGCDRRPIDLGSPSETLRLRAYIWPDQIDRQARLDQALKTAELSPVLVDEADATYWARERLAPSRKDVATVLFHSIVWQYILADDQARLETIILAAGQRATRRAPFAWLRMEPQSSKAAALHLTLWPDGRTSHLADVDYHGRWINWRHLV